MTPWTAIHQAPLSLSPRICSNSCPLSRWCYPTISSSVVPFSAYLQSFPASGSAPGLVLADCIELLHLWLKEYNQSDFSVDHLVMSMCRVFSCAVGRPCLLWPVHSLGKTLLAFALLHSVLQGQICLLLQVFLDFLLLHSSPFRMQKVSIWSQLIFSPILVWGRQGLNKG